MQNAYIITGTVKDKRTLALDEELPGDLTKVRLVIEPLTNENGSDNEDQAIHSQQPRPLMEVMEEIRASQRARGHVPRTAEEVDAYLREERESWGD
jgi:hypothetical protein